jgi:hypothetical protein
MRVLFIARLALPAEEAIFDKTFDNTAGENIPPATVVLVLRLVS